jgi:cysteine desulfurase
MLRQFGFTVEELPVDQAGLIRIDILRQMLDNDTALVSVQLANNEVGVIQSVRQVADLAHEVGALVHSDAAQGIGKIDCHVDELNVDMASFSAHKIYGPKGIGALFLRQGLAHRLIEPVFGGGGQELGFRPGTLNVPGIIGMGQSFDLAASRLESDAASLSHLRDTFERGILQAVEDAMIVGETAPRLPGTTNITISGVPTDVLITNVPGVCISSGSACTSGSLTPSHVLLAMGLDRESAECSFRASFGRMNTEEDVDFAVRSISTAVAHIRASLPHRS